MEEQLQAFENRPQPKSYRLVDFERAEVRVVESCPPRYVLVVSGTKPGLNMKVELAPLVYARRPEYWGIEVVGSVPGGICLPALTAYKAHLSDPPPGTRGIEVVGAYTRERIDVPLKGSPQGSFALSITSAVTGILVAKATLTCNPAGGSHPNPEAACTQLARVSGRIEAIPPDTGPCLPILKPVILRASGTWNGEDRCYEAEFSNACEGNRATGGVVFAFGGIWDQTEQSEGATGRVTAS
jgi:hypothetical protein